ncbi:MAG TPA: hypothetical protein VFV72_02760 [Candidatus Limnocylindrales bacterium]|nr:hypothetical protein [Candidatus Limnocylindrales bacterium]
MPGKKRFLDTDEAAVEEFDTEGHIGRRLIDDESGADTLRRFESEGDDDEPATPSARRLARR